MKNLQLPPKKLIKYLYAMGSVVALSAASATIKYLPQFAAHQAVADAILSCLTFTILLYAFIWLFGEGLEYIIHKYGLAVFLVPMLPIGVAALLIASSTSLLHRILAGHGTFSDWFYEGLFFGGAAVAVGYFLWQLPAMKAFFRAPAGPHVSAEVVRPVGRSLPPLVKRVGITVLILLLVGLFITSLLGLWPVVGN